MPYPNHDIDEGDLPGKLPHFSGVDQPFCENACNNTESCVGYSYGKWDRACYLKGRLPDLRFEPNSNAAIRSSVQQLPPNFPGARKVISTQRSFVGNRYSTSATKSRQVCSELCLHEEKCVGYQYVGSECWRFDEIDNATKDERAQAGVKRQPEPEPKR